MYAYLYTSPWVPFTDIPHINIRAHSLTIPVFFPLQPVVLYELQGRLIIYEAVLSYVSIVLESTFQYAERARPFKYTHGTGVSYYLRGLAVWPALHVFKCRYRKYNTQELVSTPSRAYFFSDIEHVYHR